MMTGEELSRSVVSVLSDYLIRKSTVGNVAFTASLENLLGEVEAKLTDPYAAEKFARFVGSPSDSVEVDTLQLHLAREIAQDPGFGRQLQAGLVGQKPGKSRTRGKRLGWALAALGVIVALVAVFVIARVTASTEAQPTTPAVTTTLTETVRPSATVSATSSVSTATSTTEPSIMSTTAGVPGDGGSLEKGVPVFLTALPRPNDDWNFKYGDHDVQLTQYPNSLWNTLATCNSGSHRGEQEFRLKNFSKLEVKAVGTDSTSDPRLTVKFEVFINADEINPKQTVVVNPGEAKPLSVDLPPGTFALRLRTSFTTATGPPCRAGNAVWGSPYVIAAGR